MNASGLLLQQGDVQIALGSAARLERSRASESRHSIGGVLRAAAVDSAYVQFTGGSQVEGEEKPLAVAVLALIFDSTQKANHTFTQVAQAAHLRTEMDGADVAVETVTAPSGIVSYWGYVHRDAAIVILTLDTLHPEQIAMPEFRGLVVRAVERLAADADG